MERRNRRSTIRDPVGTHHEAIILTGEGKPTFRGTRIMVAQVLRQVARGMARHAITAEWRGAVTKDAISGAVELGPREPGHRQCRLV